MKCCLINFKLDKQYRTLQLLVYNINQIMLHFSTISNIQISNFNVFHMPPYQISYFPTSQIYLFGNASTPTLNYENHIQEPTQLQITVSSQKANLIPKTISKQEQKAPQQKMIKYLSNDDEAVSQVKEREKQKFGRNIFSNIFHLMIKYVMKEKKIKSLVFKIIQSNRMNIKVIQFYQIIKTRSYKLKTYVSLLKIKEFWKGPSFRETESAHAQKEMECAKIFRIVSLHYLKYSHFPYIFSTLKIKSQSKKLHMKAIRRILLFDSI